MSWTHKISVSYAPAMGDSHSSNTADHFIKYRSKNAMHLIALFIFFARAVCACTGMEFIDASAYSIDPSIDRSVISFR